MERRYCTWAGCERRGIYRCECGMILCRKHGEIHVASLERRYGLTETLTPIKAAVVGGNR